MRNSEIATAFYRLAELLEIGGANPFRVRAYRNAARTLEGLPESAEEMLAQGKDLAELPGIGRDLADKIAGMIATGRLAALEAEEKRLPASLIELATIPGLGAKRIRLLHEKLAIAGIPALAKAAAAGQLTGLPGFGPKLQAKIREALAHRRVGPQRWRIDAVGEIARDLLDYLKADPAVEKAEAAGSLRRRRDSIGDLDIVAASRRPAAVIDRFTKFGEVAQISSKGPTRSTVLLRSGLQVDIRVVPGESYGAALLYLTGSKAHNIALRTRAQKRGLKLNEYGIFKGRREITAADESAIYRLLGLPYIEPEIREARGEIEAALAKHLPRLVSLADIRGDLHVHSKASDGQSSIAEMAEAARRRGRTYIAIADHSRHLTIAHGLDERHLARQIEDIERLNQKNPGIRILKSAEVDILSDGKLDLPDSILRELDVVVCAVHSNFDLPEAKQTARIIKAMDHPCFDILAHPTGRLINERQAYTVNIEKLLSAAKERGCFLEINAQPERLDLDDVNARLAKDMGVKLAISTDAHSIAGLDLMGYGVDQARRAWLSAEDVLNARPWPALRRLLRRR
jgi:DNA polymerase (family 10)